MKTTRHSLSIFRGRLLRAAGLAAMTVPLVYGTACTTEVIVDDPGAEDDGGGGGNTGGNTGGSNTGGSNSGGSNTGGSNTGGAQVGGSMTVSVGVGAGPATTSSGVGGSTAVTEACYPPDMNMGCPTLEGAPSYYGDCTWDTSMWIEAWLSGPVLKNGECCYDVVANDFCGIGRPLIIDDHAVTAEAVAGDHGWGSAPERDVEGLTPEQREMLAHLWTGDALYEHASVASFARLSLELMALGAPSALVSDAHRAALDEIEHAKMCFALAGRYRAEPVGAGALDVVHDLSVRSDLVELAVATFNEGCVGETLAAILAAEQAARASDEQVATTLATIAEDEARHAEMAWRTVAWAINQGGREVRDAVARASLDAARHVPIVESPADDSLEAHGRLPASDVSAIHRQALLDVVLPCVQALLKRADAPRPAVAALASIVG